MQLKLLLSIAIVVLSLCAVPQATAGPLATTNRALNDGFGPDAGRWHGTISVVGAAFGDTLDAEVDWAVFAPGKFQQFLDDQGIAGPDPSGANELIYVYQVAVITAASPGIDTITVGIDASDGRGTISAPAFVSTGAATEKSPTGGGDNSTSMAWFFDVGTQPVAGDTSSFLVFTSPFSPEYDFFQMNSGLAGPVVSPLVASPSDRRFQFVPEPSSLLLGLLGLGIAGLGRSRRRR